MITKERIVEIIEQASSEQTYLGGAFLNKSDISQAATLIMNEINGNEQSTPSNVDIMHEDGC